jgi:hypothetical protein
MTLPSILGMSLAGKATKADLSDTVTSAVRDSSSCLPWLDSSICSNYSTVTLSDLEELNLAQQLLAIMSEIAGFMSWHHLFQAPKIRS